MGNYLALGHGARTSMRSVRTPCPQAKYFPIQPSHLVNKHILLFVITFFAPSSNQFVPKIFDWGETALPKKKI